MVHVCMLVTGGNVTLQQQLVITGQCKDADIAQLLEKQCDSRITAFKLAGIEVITETYQTLLFVMQHNASHCKTDADQHCYAHAPISPAHAKEAQVLAMCDCQILFIVIICFSLLQVWQS